MKTIITLLTSWFVGLLFSALFAQTFTRITDQSYPIVSDSFPGGYPGAAWIDYNNDNLLDLFVNNDYLYKNEGNDNFSRNLTFKGRTQAITPPNVIGSGNSWADYDNDGDLDMFSASAKSFLFRNEGDETFTKITAGNIGDSIANRGWTCSWGDYDNDGNVDLLVVHPANFVPGTPIPNRLLHNDGPPDYTFTPVTGFHFTTQLAPYTVGTWSDYDLDSDIDLFIGSGPATGSPARDYLYKNLLKESGSADFERIVDSPIGTDLQDGQVWNLIDYDNDGDLDAFLTNYFAAPNRFYRNDNNSFTLITTGMELSGNGCLANTWGDFDNDGFLDVVITSEASNFFYRNNGDGTFTSISNAITISGNERGAVIGDYDNDGDLDLFIVGLPAARGLFRNDNDNGYNWKKLRLIGIESNKSAIGAVVKLKANINGTSMWQIREVSAQNSFNSMNSLIVHFGLREAVVIDSVIINWPSGIQQVLTDVSVNNHEEIEEAGSTDTEDKDTGFFETFKLEQNYPNPFNPSTTIKFVNHKFAFINLSVYDILGNKVKTLVNEEMQTGVHEIDFNAGDLASGIYFCQLMSKNYTNDKVNYSSIKKMIYLK